MRECVRCLLRSIYTTLYDIQYGKLKPWTKLVR